MQPFRGSLAHHRLSFLMPALLEGRRLSGTLRLERGAVARTFLFRDGHLVGAWSNDPAEHLAQVLVDLRVLEGTQAAAAFEAAHAAGRALGEFLVERGFVDRMRLVEALEHKAREAFFDCYTWEVGELTFEEPVETEPAPRTPGVPLELKAGPLHRDGMARLREWRAFREVFPTSELLFDVYRECMVDWGTDADAALVDAAERGGSLAELLASSREGALYAARRVLNLYRRGVLSPRTPRTPTVGLIAPPGELVMQARRHFHLGDFATAAKLAAQALDRAPVPEAHALYRQAELHLIGALRRRAAELEGRLVFGTLPRPAPPGLTADDLYLFARLKAARSVKQALQSAAMGEDSALRALQRLMESGLVWETQAPSTVRRRTTDPLFTLPA